MMLWGAIEDAVLSSAPSHIDVGQCMLYCTDCTELIYIGSIRRTS